ncbi:MAG: DUF1700 domain-containing protein [Oscillospiraceae bacterium]|nr:DUF1700 domain-containing protein [Oscillospiraceae bacterium]
MTRAEYIAELESHLITLPREERDMAVSFYKEYFDEAGPDKEQEVISELGKPYNLAKSIIGETSLYNRSDVYINYKASKPMPQNNTDVFVSLQKPGAFSGQAADTAEDIMPKRAQEQDKMPRSGQGQNNTNPDPNIRFYGANADSDTPKQEQKSSEQNNNEGSGSGMEQGMFDQYYQSGYKKSSDSTYKNVPPKKKSISAGKVIFWVLMMIFVILPIIIPLAITIPLVMLAIGIAAAACIITAIIAIVTGVIQIFVSIPTAIAYGAVGLLIAGIGFMMLSAALAFFFRFLPWMAKKIVKLTRRLAA